MKNKKGITLIALIITIIVMVILAGVAISMTITEDGVMIKAEQSSTKLEKQEIYEKIVSAAIYDENGKLKVQESYKNTKEILGEENLTLTREEAECIMFKIKGKKKNYIGKIQNNGNEIKVLDETFATKVKPENYGDKVNYVSSNGVSDWRIFYSDGTYVFLIKEGGLSTDKIDTTILENSKINIAGINEIKWGNGLPNKQETNYLELFRCGQGGDLSDSNSSNNVVSTLLNDKNWENLKDEEGKAKAVIGTPTLEMWIKSWNLKYEDSLNYTFDNRGYKIYYSDGTGSTTFLNIKNVGGNTSKAYTDDINGKKLYFPFSSAQTGNSGYWIAASATNASNIYKISYSGNMDQTRWDLYSYSIRPVVCLNSDVAGKLVGDTWELE